MATLEKIRSKSVLLFVIIIVALLAFILGDFLTSGRTYFGSGTTMAKAGSAKVDYHDYQARMEQVGEQQRNQQQAVDNDEMSQDVLRQLLFEKMLDKEFETLGITVTDGEISEAMTGATPHPAAQQFIYVVSQRLGLPSPSGAAVYDAMMNPTKYGLPAEVGQQLQQLWAAQERSLEEAMKQEKFGRLVAGLFTANDLDARSMYNDVVSTRHIQYASKDYAGINDADVEVTDEDRRRAWNEDKEMYRLTEPVRSIDYVMVRIEPSQADRLAGQKDVEDAIEVLNAEPGTATIAANSKFVVNNVSSARSQMTDNRLKQFVDTAKVGQAALISTMGETYTIAKLLNVTNEIDSINITMIGRADQGALDSLLAQVVAGAKFDEIVDQETVQGQDSVWTSLAGPNVPAAIKSALTNRAVGEAFILTDTIQGQPVTTLYRINKRNSAVPYYELALVEYTVDPSQETLSTLSDNLNTFVSNNSSADEFAKNAAEAGYTLQKGFVSASSPHIGNLADSRSVVKWAMNAKAGQVMPVYQDNKQTYMLTLAVKNIYDDDYLPYDADLIADQVNAKALRNVKSAKLIQQYKGKAQDVAGYAQLMGVTPQTGDAVFNSPVLATLGFGESALQGAVAAAEPGKVVGPVAGNNAVVVFVVTGEDNSGREYDFEEYSNQYNRSMGISTYRLQRMENLFPMLLGKNKVVNKSLDFIQGFGDK